ncbi:uncharacterized protein LOC115456347 [Manduca sexta]|uniref:uncharacterized protein LOC115456347 n=1 Tax=Manduca sexta TaxID=7130 RepID=UPI00118201CA|nr:uncharacterized protein LOC115456347 [Manduca sexta]
MQDDSQNCDIPKVPKRSKSITRYPKIMPTYVVAFAMHETYDDLMTAQQMICKQSPQGSINSVTPKNSVKILDPNATEKFTHITDMSQDNDQTEALKDAAQCADIKKSSETTLATLTNSNSIQNIQPEVIFNSVHVKLFKDESKFRKKNHKNKRVDKKNFHFKCKHCKSITKKIKLRYNKSKRNAVATDIVERGLCNLSNIINQSRILKKVFAVENLLEEQPLSDRVSTEEFSSLSSSTTKKDVLSHSSDNTLTRKWSSSSSRNDNSSINTYSSVIQVSSENVIPYKTDVLNVAVAVAFNKAKANECKQRQFITNEEVYLAKQDLTGADTVILPTVTLTSKPSSYENTHIKNARDIVNHIEDASSNATLIGNNKKSSLAISIDEDTFVIARTSSDFNKSSFNSNLTLTNSEIQSDETITGNEGYARDSDYNNEKLLNAVINLGMFPESNPSTSKFNENAVIVTKEHKTYVKKDDDVILNEQGDLVKNILKKNFDVEKNLGVHKIITLPDETIIRAKLKENHVTQSKTENEFPNTNPSTLSEMWDRLILILDAALKRIEETLPNRIIQEIKKILDFDNYKNFVLKVMSEKTADIAAKESVLNKGVYVDMLQTETDENLQCDLLQNQVIDRLMTKLYPEGPTINSPKFSHKLITKIFREYLDDLSPGLETDIEKEETMSGVEPELAQDVSRFHRLKVLLSVPIKFMKENAFVMTSVPTFLLILLCMYGLVVFIMKPL